MAITQHVYVHSHHAYSCCRARGICMRVIVTQPTLHGPRWSTQNWLGQLEEANSQFCASWSLHGLFCQLNFSRHYQNHGQNPVNVTADSIIGMHDYSQVLYNNYAGCYSAYNINGTDTKARIMDILSYEMWVYMAYIFLPIIYLTVIYYIRCRKVNYKVIT